MQTSDDSMKLFFSSLKKAIKAGEKRLIERGFESIAIDSGNYSTLIHSNGELYIMVEKETVY